MLLGTAALLGGALSAVGGLASGAMSMGDNALNRSHEHKENELSREFTRGENALNRDFNANEAQKARDFELMMSNTAMQRGVKDAQLAGINPALSAGGSGASTPTAISASNGSSQSSMVGAGTHGLGSMNFDALTKAMITTADKNPKAVIGELEKQANSSLQATKKASSKLMKELDSKEWNQILNEIGSSSGEQSYTDWLSKQ